MVASEFQKKVFQLAVKKAKECRAKNPNKPYMQCMKEAWKTPEVVKALADYRKAHPADDDKKKKSKK